MEILQQKGAVETITCDVIAASHELSDIKPVARAELLATLHEQENTIMTQTLNASNTSSNGAKETLATEASTGKQAGFQDARLGHVGLHATNPAA